MSNSARKVRNFPESNSGSSPEIDDSFKLDDARRPPSTKKIWGWSDEAVRSGKSKTSTNIIEQERFQSTKNAASFSDDDIPIIPDLDDIQDDEILNAKVEAPAVTINRLAMYKELNSDLLKEGAFTSMEDFDLSILGKYMREESKLIEADDVWTYDKLFTEISAEINGEKPNSAKTQYLN